MPDIRFDQGDTGTVNRSRSDITISVSVDIVSLAIVGTPIFGLLDRPVGSSAAITGAGGTRQIVPDVAGKYRIRIIDDNDSSEVIHTFTVRTFMRKLQKPAFNERAIDDANDVDADPGSWVDDAETNEGGVFTGWNPEQQEMIDSLDRVSNLAAVDPTATDDEDDGYVVGAIWINSVAVTAFVLMDATAGAAVWVGISPTDMAAVQGRRTTAFTLVNGVFGDITLDLTDVENDTAVLEHDNVNTDRVLVKETGLYLIHSRLGGLAINQTSVETRIRIDDTTVIPGSLCSTNGFQHNQSHDYTVDCFVLGIITAGSFISLQAQQTGVNADTAVADITLQVVRLRTGGAGGTGGGGGGGGFPDVQVFADMFEPVNADWPITVLAPAVKLAATSRVEISFDDATETAVGFQIRVPDGAANMTLELISRAQTAPGAAQVALYNVRESGSPDNAADDAFSAPFQFPNIDIPTNAFRQYDEVTRTLAEWGIVEGQVHQFCLSRDTGDAGDTLPGNLLLLAAFARFT